MLQPPHASLPLVATAGLTICLFYISSDNDAKEVLLSDNVQMLSMDSGAESWAEAILKTVLDRITNAKMQLRDKGYDIDVEALKLQEWYEHLIES